MRRRCLSSCSTISIKSGFSIAGILSRDTTRYQFTRPPEIIDLGLRLADVNEYRLQSEPEDHGNTDPTSNLRLNGATNEEIEFLAGEADYAGHYHNGRRVELNALTSDQFIQFLEAKLRFHGVPKVIPDAVALEEAYRRSRAQHELDERIQEALPEIKRIAESAAIPEDLQKRIAEELAENPSMAWDEALHRLSNGSRPR